MKLRIWDLPTRVFHLCLILSLFGSFATIYLSDDLVLWHARIGLFFLSLVLFRVIWGFCGGHWSRFHNFLSSPSLALNALRETLQGRTHFTLGHNPLGAWSVLWMMSLLLLQVLSGLCSEDDVAFSGPLTQYLSDVWVERASWYHTEMGVWLIVVSVSVHVLMIFWYRKRYDQDLVTPMITGDKDITPPTGQDAPIQSADAAPDRIMALVIFALIAFLVYGVIEL
jgi:cytochrome b